MNGIHKKLIQDRVNILKDIAHRVMLVPKTTHAESVLCDNVATLAGIAILKEGQTSALIDAIGELLEATDETRTAAGDKARKAVKAALEE